MTYESLYKIRYKAPQQYETIYQARYSHHDTIHLNFKINDDPAFICQSAELLYMIINIHKADKNIRALRRRLPKVAINQFTSRCLVDEIILTNDIEGVNSTRREITEVLEKLQEKKSDRRFYGLVMKYAMLAKRASLKLDTCQDVRDIYNDLVLREVIEENPNDAPDGQIFRKNSVSVTNAAQQEIHQGLLPESAIQTAVQSVLDFIKDDSVDLLIRTAAAHYLFGYIHPFYNGNGRLSRFISSFLMTQELDPLIAYRLSYTIKENLKQYDDAFKLCNDPRNKGDLTPFVLWFMEVILEAISKLNDALTERAHDLKHYSDLLDKSEQLHTKQLEPLSYVLIQASLFSHTGISTGDLLVGTEYSRSTLQKRLKKIDEYGLLLTQRHGKEKCYKLDLGKFEQQTRILP